MTELQKQHIPPYDMVLRQAMQDHQLSWEATGMLAYLISLPNGWAVKIEHIAKLRSAGRDRVRRILRELTDAGYLVRRNERRDDGTFRYVTYLYQNPAENPYRGSDRTLGQTVVRVTRSTVEGGDIDIKDLEIEKSKIKQTRNNNNNIDPAVVVALMDADILKSAYWKIVSQFHQYSGRDLEPEDVRAWQHYMLKTSGSLSTGFLVSKLMNGETAPESHYEAMTEEDSIFILS